MEKVSNAGYAPEDRTIQDVVSVPDLIHADAGAEDRTIEDLITAPDLSSGDAGAEDRTVQDLITAPDAPPTTGEFLLLRDDRTFAEGENGFHYYHREGWPVPETWPADWTDPEDYWHGEWYVRIDLNSHPTEMPFTLQTCIWMHDADGSSGYDDELESCGRQLLMEGLGVYEFTTGELSTWWHKSGGSQAVDISRPHHFKRLGLVLRKEPFCYISPYDINPNCWDERANYVPFDFNITIVAVADGATFSGWSNYVD